MMRRADSSRSPELALAQDRTLTMNKPEQSQDAEPSLQESPAPALASRLRVRGRSFIGSGIVLVVAFVLTVANAGYGTNPDPNRAFGERRSYNMVKTSVHDAVPDAAPYLAGALLLFWLGRRQLRRADLLDPPADA